MKEPAEIPIFIAALRGKTRNMNRIVLAARYSSQICGEFFFAIPGAGVN